jgi:hypothetical protein
MRPQIALACALAVALALLQIDCELLSLDYLQDGHDASTTADVVASDADDSALPYIVYYKFEGNTLDSSGHGFTGTLHGNANVAASGVLDGGGSLSCATTGDSMTFPAGAFDAGTSSFSVAFFFKLALGADGGPLNPQDNTLFEKGGNWSTSLDTDPAVGLGYWPVMPFNLNAYVHDQDPAPQDWVSAGYLPPVSAPLADGNFHHVAFVVDRAQEQIAIYVDAIPRGSARLPARGDGSAYGSISSTDVGRLCSMTADPTQTLSGSIDEFMIVSKALSLSDITSLPGVRSLAP